MMTACLVDWVDQEVDGPMELGAVGPTCLVLSDLVAVHPYSISQKKDS